jgi:hypothetical protein
MPMTAATASNAARASGEAACKRRSQLLEA